jgi:hypothetical protein
MATETNDLRQLAARISKGDSSAVPRFVQQLEPQLACMIRRIIRTGSTDSVVAQRVAAEAKPLSAAGLKGGNLIDEITGRICRAAVDGLRSGHAADRSFLDTVLGNRARERTTVR